MLVLTRKPGEAIIVPHSELTLTVLAVEGKKVRLGFLAPHDIDVFREELWRQIRESPGTLAEPVPSTADEDRDAFAEILAAELTSAVNPVLVRHAASGQWLDMELELWKVLTESIKNLALPNPNCLAKDRSVATPSSFFG
jgi:carbon storage regulator